MNSIEKLKQEHEKIERELIELETIMQDEIINYPNLIHVLKKLISLWDDHEQEEERIFPILKHERIIIPVKKMSFQHKELSLDRKAITQALKSGSEIKIKEALNENGKTLIKKLREHMDYEDEILYRITLENFTPKELDELNEIQEDRLEED